MGYKNKEVFIIKKKIVLGFVLIFLSLIPMIYSGLFLGASLDPYGNMDQLPVAIVNSEKNIIQEKLFEEKLFDLKEETSMDSAMEKLRDGKVYAIISFGEDFQSKITTFPKLKENAEIQLITSEGLNSFSSKVITSTMNQFVQHVNAELSSKIIDKMQGMNIPDSTGSIVKLQVKNIHPVKNNGEVMAPYLFSLTLFVAGIFVNQFTMRNLKKKGEKFTTYWTKQYVFPVIIGLVQVLLLLSGNFLFIHIPVNSLYQLMAFLFLTSATFLSIIVGFNKLIPGIGSLIVLILTMFQTSAAAGVYPILLTNSLFEKINACIPMTYTIRGLRSIISLESINLAENVYVLIGFLIFGQFLILLSYLVHERRFKKTSN